MEVPVALEELIAALRQHARLMSEPGSAGEAGVEAYESLRSAAVSYGRSVREATGWDSPFDELEEVEGLGVIDETEEHTGSDRSDDSSRSVERCSDTCFVVSGSWAFEVTDRAAWSDFVTRQPGTAELLEGQTHIAPAEAAAALLASDTLRRIIAPHGAVLTHQEWGVSDTPSEYPDEDPDAEDE
ncbi:hypothetical protein ABT034_32120 [Streptomyces sp. NPDC002773]|uniref:hypothetical protein n=1 Tax=Streptomyces sp. NPDC002773 TaxID=3154430 RepID=UPI003322F834